MTTGPNEVLRLHAFIDGELDLPHQLELEEQLRHDAALRSEVERLRALRESVRERARYHAAPAELRSRIGALLGPPRRASSASSPARWRPWAAASAFAAAAIVSANLWLSSVQQRERIEQDVIASHVRATLGQRQVDVASSDHHTVKPWLSSKLDFSPPVHELTSPGAALLGGRVDYIAGRPVAALAYKYAGHSADEFVWPASDRDRGIETASQRGFNIAHWTKGGMAHWLVSDMAPPELAQLARSMDAMD
ncbi:MAG TPA: anti-sigma factor [Ramlibacter sp.]